jgi:hypothetical protein
LGEEASRAGPLDARSRRLIHLALAIAASSEGATHSHARRGSSEGISAEELEHVAILAVTTVGWSQAIKGLTWVRDVTRAPPDTAASQPLEPLLWRSALGTLPKRLSGAGKQVAPPSHRDSE